MWVRVLAICVGPCFGHLIGSVLWPFMWDPDLAILVDPDLAILGDPDLAI